VLELTNVVVRISDQNILNNVSLKLDFQTRAHCLIGPNGSGKSTLFNVINGVLKPSTGKVFLSGRDISRLPLNRRAELGVLRTFQNGNLFGSLSVYDHLRLGGFSEGKIRDHLSTYSLMDALKKRGDELSFGQRKLLGMALIDRPDATLRLYDEPSAGLSPPMANIVAANILAGKGVAFVIDHDFEFLEKLGGKGYFLNGGEVMAFDSLKNSINSDVFRAAYS